MREGLRCDMNHEINIADNINRVRDKICAASLRCGRLVDDVTLVAVSKHIPVKLIREAIEVGHFVFGESYVQEIRTKIAECNGDRSVDISNIRFDLIGHLQRNKAKHAVGLCQLIHSIDSREIANVIDSVAEKKGIKQDVLVQVNISGEESKSGVNPDLAKELCYEISMLSNVSLLGLMCIGEGSGDILTRRKEFFRMRELRESISTALCMSLPELSMGMSDDFECAIEEGATIVRVGSAIFGFRD